MRKWLVAAASLAALAGASGLALAQNTEGAPSGPPPGAPHGRFLEADANHDGVVTRQEFNTFRAAEFARVDANHDGQLSRDERRVGRHWAHRRDGRMGGLMGPMGGPAGGPPPGGGPEPEGGPGGHRFDPLERADANHDGNVSREEFLAGPNSMFDRLDANHDGVISADEREAARQHRHDAMQQRRADHPNPDANGDGVISRAEWDGAGAAMFARFDANHDGRVTRDEFEAARPHHDGR